MTPSSTDRIEKQITLKAPVARVWRALTDHKEFGSWFQVHLESPFTPDKPTTGRILHPGFEHVTFNLFVVKMEHERLFSFNWHPYAIDPKVDYSKEKPTLIEFTLTKIPEGTLLNLTESGFDALPLARRAEAFRMNEGGWEEQMQNIKSYVSKNP